MGNGCTENVRVNFAEAYRGLALAMFGTGARDKIHLAEMSVTASVADISSAEQKIKDELGSLVRRIRELDPQKQRGAAQEILGRSRMLRGTLASMSKKRTGMQQHLETLRQSQLNQNMLTSMKHTSDALQTMGLSARDADSILLDLEESAGDSKELTATLASNFMEETCSLEDLDAELELMMSEDALCAVPMQHRPPAQKRADAVEPVVAPQVAVPAPDDVAGREGGDCDDTNSASLEEQDTEQSKAREQAIIPNT